MNYKETLEYILKQLPMYQRIGKAAYRSGLENTLKLDKYFNHPHRNFRTIHVAGTNGKGSVSHMLASVLQEAGYITGLYTSPHLVDFRERVRINGMIIEEKFVTDFINAHKAFFETFDPSFFEISVFLAFDYFRENRVDIAVIEVGLGGRLDATNIITPVLSVITNIGMDHTEILGDTIEKIAAEKAGIIKQNIPVIIGESRNDTLQVFQEFSRALPAPMIVADKLFKTEMSKIQGDDYQTFDVWRYKEIFYNELKCGLLGHYQQKNVTTVMAVIDRLNSLSPDSQVKINQGHVRCGLKNVIPNTGLAGRWQIIQKKPLVVCDTAHNCDGIRVVFNQVRETSYEKLHLIIGFVSDKDIMEILKFLPLEASYYFVRLSVPRTMDEKELASKASGYGLRGKAYVNIRRAFNHAMKYSDINDFILITGSNFLVADFLQCCLER